MTSKSDRAAGLLIGLIVGDKNLGPMHMALMVAESLEKNKKFNKLDIFSSYLDWFENKGEGSDDTGVVGLKVFKIALESNFNESNNKQEMIKKISKEVDNSMKGLTGGINPSHRNTPISMSKFISLEELIKFSKEECKMTHQSIYAEEAATVSNLICRLNIEGEMNFQEILQFLLENYKFEKLIEDALKTPSLKFKPRLDLGGFSPKTLETVLCFVEKYTKSIDFKKLNDDQRKAVFRECMEMSFKFSGKPNYSPVLVGSILGSIVGISGIPSDMYSHSPCILRALEVSKKLSNDWKEE